MATGSRRAKRRSTDRGRWALTGALLCAAVGIDTDLTLIYQLFAFLVAMIIVSRYSLRYRVPQIEVRRHLPKYATAGEPFRYSITVRNTGTNIEHNLKLLDNPLNLAPTFEEFRNSREPGEETRNAWDRFIGYHRFNWLQRQKTGLSPTSIDAPPIPLLGKVDVEASITPLRRGVVTLKSISVLWPDPFGLNQGVQHFKQLQQILVLPKRYKVSKTLELGGGRHFQPGGINPSWSIGESHEFVSLRDYRDGDSLRKIHWASSAKRAKPVVKEYQDEYFVRQALILDTHTASPIILEEVVAVAASLALQYDPADSLLDLLFTQDSSQIITAGRGYNLVNKQLEALATLSAASPAFSTLADAAVAHAPLTSGVILVLSNWDDERAALRNQLRSLGLQTLTLIVATDDLVIEEAVDIKRLPVAAVEKHLDSI